MGVAPRRNDPGLPMADTRRGRGLRRAAAVALVGLSVLAAPLAAGAARMTDAPPGRTAGQEHALAARGDGAPTVRPLLQRGSMAMGLVAGLAAAGVMMLGRNAPSRGLRRLERIEAETGLRVLATLPDLVGKGGAALLQDLAERPLSGAAEAVRTLRTALSVPPGSAVPQVILLTADEAGAATTQTAAALAQSLAGVGRSVLLVGTDLRSRDLAAFLGVTPPAGLLDVLGGDAAVEDAILRVDPWGFDVIAGLSGSQPGLPDMLAGDRFDDMMAVLRTGYDVVLLVTVALSEAPDARIAGRHADAVLLCLRWSGMDLDRARRAVGQLDGIGTRSPGIVVTRGPRARARAVRLAPPQLRQRAQ